MGLFLLVVGIVLISQDSNDDDDDPTPTIAYILMALGVICMAATFCGKLDRVIVHLKSTTPILCLFMNRAVEMQVPIGQGANAYNLIRAEVAKYQDDYAAI